MKNNRQAVITELIETYSIGKQEELIALLKERGFKVAQATVSRDIKELSLIKTVAPDGSYRYSIPSLKKSGMQGERNPVLGFISDSVLAVDYAGNTVVVKCHVGMAQAVCAKLDSTEIENVVKEGSPVYLTKNGYGSMVVMSIEAYSRLTEPEKNIMGETDKAAASTSKRLTHEEVFGSLRGKINAI